MKLDHLLARFNEWFSSPQGVWQTLGVTAIIVAAELAFPQLDPHGFWLLYWVTIYSAITQPALAFSGAHNDARLSTLEIRELDELNAIQEHMAALEDLVKEIRDGTSASGIQGSTEQDRQ